MLYNTNSTSSSGPSFKNHSTINMLVHIPTLLPLWALTQCRRYWELLDTSIGVAPAYHTRVKDGIAIGPDQSTFNNTYPLLGHPSLTSKTRKIAFQISYLTRSAKFFARVFYGSALHGAQIWNLKRFRLVFDLREEFSRTSTCSLQRQWIRTVATAAILSDYKSSLFLQKYNENNCTVPRYSQ